MAERSIKLRLDAEAAPYIKSLNAAEKATAKLGAAADLAAQDVKVAGARQKEAAATIATAEKALAAARGDSETSARDLAKAERVVEDAKRDHMRATHALAAAEEDHAEALAASSAAQKRQQTMWGRGAAFYKENRADIDKVGDSLLKTGLVGVSSLGAMAKAASSWESSWAGVTKTVDGTSAQMAKLEQDLRNMAKFEVPASHEEIADVAAAAGQLGIQTGNVTKFTRTMIDMGESTNLSADQAATSIARFTNVMGTSQNDVDRIGSAVVGLGNNFATTESEIMDMAMRLAGAGKQANMTEADVLGISASMSSVGIEAEAGGSAMSLTMKRIGSEVETGGAKLETFAAVAGMSSGEFSKAWGQDSAAALTKFIGGLSDTERLGMSANAVLSELGITGIRESDALLRLSSANDLMTNSLGLSATAYEENIALAEEAEKRYATSESRIKMAWNGIKDSAIEVGAYVLPVVVELAEGVADLVGWFDSLPGPVKHVVTGLGGMASVAALAGGGAIKLAGSIADNVLAFKNLSAASPGTAAGIGRVSKAAAVGVPAFLALIAAASYDGEKASQGLAAIEAGIKNLANGATSADTIFRNIDDGSWLTGQQESLKGFLDNYSSDSIWTKVGNKGADFTTGLVSALTFGTVTVRSSLQEQRDEFRGYAQEIANLAATDLPTAIAAFQGLNNEAGGLSQAELLEQMPEFRDQLVGIADSAGLATDDATLLKIAMGELEVGVDTAGNALAGSALEAQKNADALAETSQAADDAFQSMLDLANGVLGLRDANRGFESAIDAANDAIAKNGKNLDITTEAGRANQAAIDNVASSGLQMVEAAREQGASQEELEKKMAGVRASYIAAATGAGMSKKAAKALADELGLIPKNVTSKINVETDKASEAITGIHNQIVNLPGGKTVTITTNKVTNETTYRTAPRGHGVAYEADGGRINAPGRAGGGRLPYTGLGTDQILGISSQGNPTAWVDDGEWVIRERSASKYDRLLGLVNEDHPSVQHLAALASGGRVGTYEKEVAAAKKAVSSAKKAVSSAKKTKSSADDKKADKRLKEAEKRLATAEKRLADLKSTRSSLTSGVAEKSYTYDEATGTVKTSNSLMDQGTGGLSGAYSLVDEVKAASKLSGLTSKQRAAMSKAAKDARKEFEKLYKQAELLEGKLGKAQGHLQEMASVKASVGSALAGGWSLGDAFDTASRRSDALGNVWSDTKGSAAGAIASGSAYAGKLKAFAEMLKKLSGWGLSSQVLQEIAGEGVDKGMEIARGISKTQVAQLNGTFTDINKYSQLVGEYATKNYTTSDGTFYANGAAGGESAVAAIKAQQAQNSKDLRTQTDKLLDAWGKPLNIKYDSKTGKMVSITPAKKKDGGWIVGPGTGTSDSVPIWGSNGEFMVREAQARKPQNARVLEAMNAGADATSIFASKINGNPVTVAVSATVSVQLGDIYVQNPFTGKYLKSEIDKSASDAVEQVLISTSRGY